MTLIQYTPGGCCCGRYKNLSEPVIHNDYMHEPLGPEGNFCGPVVNHTIRFLESKIESLEVELKTLKSKVK